MRTANTALRLGLVDSGRISAVHDQEFQWFFERICGKKRGGSADVGQAACTRRAQAHRRGTTLVEFAMVLPVFFTFVFGIVEYGRLQLVSNMLTTACRNGARLGATDNVTTAAAKARVNEILAAALDTERLTVTVKDASVFDTSGVYPSSAADYEALTDTELDEVEPRQLFLIRASVAYNDVALFPFAILDGVQLTGQAIMRHE